MKKRFYTDILKIMLISSLVGLSSCVQKSKLEPSFIDKQDFSVKNNPKEKNYTKKIKNYGVSVSLEWVGNAYPLETSKTMVGSVSRFVIPYTRKTSLLKLKIENTTNDYVDVELKDISLIDNVEKKETKPLTVDYFKTLWPTFAVKNQDMLIDQSFAIGEVIRTIVRDKSVIPNSTYSGYLAFPRLSQNVDNLAVKIKLNVDNQAKELIFEYEKNEKS